MQDPAAMQDRGASSEPNEASSEAKKVADAATKQFDRAARSVTGTADAARGDLDTAAQKIPGGGNGGATETTGAPPSRPDEEPQLLRDIEDIDFVHIVVILVMTFGVLWLNKTLLPKLAAIIPSRFRLYPLAVIPVARLLVLTIATGLVMRAIFDFNLENFLVIAGAASVAIGFAFKDYVSSLIAGIIAVFERPYRLGDWVRVGDHYGEVQSVGMRSLAIQTPGDDRITVPHLHLWSENISNSNDGTRTLMCVVNFYVHPDHDAETVRGKLRDVAITSAYLNYDKPVAVMLSDEPFGTHYKVKLYPFDLRDQFALISDVTVRGKEALRNAGARPVTAAMSIGEPS